MGSDNAQYENLRQFLEAIEACNGALDVSQQEAVEVEIVAEETLPRAKAAMEEVHQALTEDWNTFVQVAGATDHAIEETTGTATTTVETELPEAAGRLNVVPALLDAAVDPARSQLVSDFHSLRDEGFALAAGTLQQAATSIDAADDGGSPLQPFLELPGTLHERAVTHETDQQREAVGIELRATALAAASGATHDAAQAGARIWAESCTSLEGHCHTQAKALVSVYEAWGLTAESQKEAVAQAIKSAGTSLADALNTENGNVDATTAGAQGSLAGLRERMATARDETESGESIFMTLAEIALPELAIARAVVGKMKELAEAVGS